MNAGESPLEAALPVTPLQEGLYFHASFGGDGVDEYTSQVALRLDGAVDVDRLRSACEALVRRHAALRTSFRSRASGQLVQLVHREVPVPFDRVDLSTGRRGERDTRTRAYLTEQRVHGFELTSPPLVRFAALTVAPCEHVLVLTHHHILLDGWSMPIVLRDLLAIYAAGGSEEALPRPVSMKGFLSWLGKQDKDDAVAAWHHALEGLPSPTLVTGAGTVSSPRLPDLASVELSRELTTALERVVREQELTLNTFVQTAWALVLAKIVGETDVVFGQTSTVRPARVRGIEEAVGLLINPVPVRVRLDKDEPILGLLHRVRAEQSTLSDYVFLGLPDIQRIAGHGALFDTFVSLANTRWDWDRASATVPGVRVGVLSERAGSAPAAEQGSTHYPLSLLVVPGHRMRLELTYRPGAFARSEVERILGWLRAALRAFTETPTMAVGRVGLSDESSRAALLTASTGDPLPMREGTFPALFLEQVARRPDALAVVADDRSMTYRELADESERLARVFAGHGVGRGDRIAVALPRTSFVVSALLAAQRVGAAYLPIDVSYPTERVEFMLADSAPAVLLTTSDMLTEVRTVPRVELDRPWGSGVRPTGTVSPADPAYLIYTSGSTGRPKGVLVSGEALLNFVRAMRSRFPLGPSDALLAVTTVGFDIFSLEFYLPLACGATVVLAGAGTACDPFALCRALADHAITVLQATPSLWRGLVETNAPLRGLRALVGGEAVPAELATSLRDLGCRVSNVYGPTEATVWSTSHELTEPGAPPVGTPLPGTRAYVLDPFLRLAPDGTVGELYLAGSGIAMGYHGRAAHTAERFVADPFGPAAARMYRTGDTACRDNGVIRVLGRADHQVKIRGHRIELGEVEASLERDPAVQRAVVMPRASARGDVLVAYVVAQDSAGVLERLGQVVPGYMVPTDLVVLPELPLTPNGKVDRAALPRMGRKDSRSAAWRPRDAVERRLCLMCADLLRVDEVGIHDNFFGLGGDSILSIQLVARARAEGMVFTAKDVFGCGTVAALAALPGVRSGRVSGPESQREGAGSTPSLGREARKESRGSPTIAVPRRELDRFAAPAVKRVLRLSPVQQGLLFHARYDMDTLDVHLVQVVVELYGELDAARLRMACDGMVARHEALRAGFVVLASGEPAQLVAEHVALPWYEVDLSGAGGDIQRERMDELLTGDRRRPFDMERPPLLRCGLVRLGERRHSLVFTVHHILVDGWSIDLMLRDVTHLYREDGDASGLPTAVPYRDYLRWLATRDEDAARAAWRAELSGLADATRVAPGVDTAHIAELPQRRAVTLPRTTTEALVRTARDCGVTVNTVVQLAWAVALHRVTGKYDITFGTTVSCRSPDIPGYQEIVGAQVNTVPVRIRLDPACGLTRALARVQERQSALIEHRYLPLPEIWRSAALGALFDTCLVFENYAIAERTGTGVDTPSIGAVSGRDPYHYPVKVSVTPGQRLHMVLGYRPELVPESTALGLEQLLVDNLRVVGECPPDDLNSLLAGRTDDSRVETTLLELAREVIGTADLAEGDDIFDRGCDSLLALRLTGRIEGDLGVRLDIRSIFRNRTVRRIASLCGAVASLQPDECS